MVFPYGRLALRMRSSPAAGSSELPARGDACRILFIVNSRLMRSIGIIQGSLDAITR